MADRPVAHLNPLSLVGDRLAEDGRPRPPGPPIEVTPDEFLTAAQREKLAQMKARHLHERDAT